VKCHHRVHAIQNKLLILRIDFLLVEISFLISIITLLQVKMRISDINNKLSLVEMSILDINNSIGTSKNYNF